MKLFLRSWQALIIHKKKKELVTKSPVMFDTLAIRTLLFHGLQDCNWNSVNWPCKRLVNSFAIHNSECGFFETKKLNQK